MAQDNSFFSSVAQRCQKVGHCILNQTSFEQDSFVPVSSTAFTTELLLNFILSQNFPEVCMVFPARFSALQDSGYFLHVFVSSVAPREGELTFKCLLYARPCNSAFLFITSHLFLTANLQR